MVAQLGASGQACRQQSFSVKLYLPLKISVGLGLYALGCLLAKVIGLGYGVEADPLELGRAVSLPNGRERLDEFRTETEPWLIILVDQACSAGYPSSVGKTPRYGLACSGRCCIFSLYSIE